MIDLHTHTTYSDGTDNVKQLLENANKANLELISITDHNSCKAYLEMEDLSIRDIYKGDILVGCEFTTSYKGHIIEILGYNFDYRKVQIYLDKYYNLENTNKYANTVYNMIIDKIHKLNFTFKLPITKNHKFNTRFIEKELYDELVKYPENITLIDENIFSSFSNFFRNGLTNPNSKMYINYANLNPSLEEIIELIHRNNGLAFLAHPYQYKFENIDEFLNDIYSNHKLDGIECFHTTFNNKQINHLLNFAKNNNLLISGGSDYHGTRKKLHYLGIGNGNLNIDKSILKNWNVKLF